MTDAGAGETRDDAPARLLQALNAAGASAELRQQEHATLLEAIVTTAARVIEATAGSMLLLDELAEELVFQVAVGPGAQEIKQFRVPVGQGIAGFTASTGQALAIADTSQDARFARQIAEGSGYVPKNLLCVPLILRGELIGVMELLDKRGGSTPFTPQDTAILASFGEQAAMAIDLSLQTQSLERMLIGAARGEDDAALKAEAATMAAAAAAESSYARTLALARQVAAIAGSGERQTELCSAILTAVLRYTRTGPSSEADEMLRDLGRSSGGFF